MGKKSKLQFSIKSLLILAVFVGLLTTVAINVVRHQQAMAQEKAKAAEQAIRQAHLYSLKMKRAQLLSSYGPAHPKVQIINFEIDVTEKHFSASVDDQSKENGP